MSKPKIINIGKLNKFITIDGNIRLENPIDTNNKENKIVTNNKENKIVSFLGDDNIGKSTMMNCFISFLLNKNTKIFNKKELYRPNIYMVSLETLNENIVLLYVNEPICDHKLRLFVFIISNLIIYNERDVIKNNVLESFKSLTNIMTHIEDNHIKRTLLFRPIDLNLRDEYDPFENINELLSIKINDQFSNTRKSILKLFSDIKCKATYELDYNQKHLLSTNNFLNFLDYNNGFEDFCQYLLEQINDCSSHNFEGFNNKIETIIQQINNNENIDYNIFDITKFQKKETINNFLKKIDQSKYEPLEVDGTQQNYDNLVIELIIYSQKILNEYDKKFNLFTFDIEHNPEIEFDIEYNIFNSDIETFDIERELMIDKFNKIIYEGSNKAMNISNQRLNEIYESKINTFTTSIKLDIREDLKLETFPELQNYIVSSPWIDCIKFIFMDKLQEKITIINEKIKYYYEIYRGYYDNYITSQCSIINSFIKNKEFLFGFIPEIKLTFKTIVHNYVKDFYKYNLEKLYYCTPQLNIQFKNNYVLVEIPPVLLIPNNIILLDIKNQLKYSYSSDILTGITNEIYKYKDEFFQKRKEQLPNILNQLQFNLKLNNIDMNNLNYLEIKKLYLDTEKLFNEIIQVGNDVNFLNVFKYIFPIMDSQTDENKKRKITKYALVVKKFKIHTILTDNDFDIKYKDVLKYWMMIDDKNDMNINYYYAKQIINNLFYNKK